MVLIISLDHQSVNQTRLLFSKLIRVIARLYVKFSINGYKAIVIIKIIYCMKTDLLDLIWNRIFRLDCPIKMPMRHIDRTP